MEPAEQQGHRESEQQHDAYHGEGVARLATWHAAAAVRIETICTRLTIRSGVPLAARPRAVGVEVLVDAHAVGEAFAHIGRRSADAEVVALEGKRRQRGASLAAVGADRTACAHAIGTQKEVWLANAVPLVFGTSPVRRLCEIPV